MGKLRWSNLVFALAYIVLVVGLFLALGGSAYAAHPLTSAADQYVCPDDSEVENPEDCDSVPTGPLLPPTESEPEGPQVSGEQASTTSSGQASGTGAAALPNTGLSLAGVVIVGLGLAGAGVALRRRERRQR